MTTNEGTVDRTLRAVLAVAAAGTAGYVGAGTAAGIALLATAGILLVTAATGFCPLYRLFGISTCRIAARR